jgi:CRP/FNR family transcriptional regulator
MLTGANATHRVFRMGAASGCKPDSAVVTCANCKVSSLCLPAELNRQQLDQVEDMVGARIKVKRGSALFATGDRFKSLYVVRTGFLKTETTLEDGRRWVRGFQMAGEMLGLDAIANEAHTCDAIAMEDSDVCVMPYDLLESTSRRVVALQRHLHRAMSREILREGSLMQQTGMPAQERLAAFLLNLSERLHARGFSRSELVLRMSREEIGSAVGLKLETVSRMFSKFAADGIVTIQQRHVNILDMAALREIANAKLRSCTH